MGQNFYRLAVNIRISPTDDIALVFAEPTLTDLESILKNKFHLDLIEECLIKKEELDDKHKDLDTASFDQLNDDITNDEVEQVDTPPSEDAAPLLDNDGDNNNDQDLKPGQQQDLEIKQEEEVTEIKDDRKKNIRSNKNSTHNTPIEKVSENDYRCKVCGRSFSCATNARKHVKIHGIGTEPVEDRTCPNCSRVFKYATLCKLHLKRTCLKKSSPPACDHCNTLFTTQAELKQHKRTCYHQDDQVKCQFCDHVAASKEARDKHEKRMHLDMQCKVCRKLFSTETEKENHECAPLKPFQCEMCEKVYTTRGALKFHIESLHKGVKFPCHLCSVTLSNKQALDRHIRNVHVVSVRKYKCGSCDKAFKDKESLSRHVKLHTNTSKSDPCPHCGKVLVSARALAVHINRVHIRNFKHTCEDCGKTFPYLNTLQIHAEMVHMKGITHVCQVCGKECIGKKRLHNHMQRKHPKGQKFENCEECGKEIPTTQMKSHVYAEHKMAAYKFQCDYCPKRFDTKAHIRVHLRKHTKARPYLCRGCGKHFRDLMITKKHIRLEHAADFSLCYYDVTRELENPYV